MASGCDATDAYQNVNPSCKRTSARSAGARLFAIVCDRVKELQNATAGDTVMSLKEKRERLATRAREEDVSNQDLVALIMADAKLAGELVDKAEMKLVSAPSLADLIAAQKRMPELQGLCGGL